MCLIDDVLGANEISISSNATMVSPSHIKHLSSSIVCVLFRQAGVEFVLAIIVRTSCCCCVTPAFYMGKHWEGFGNVKKSAGTYNFSSAREVQLNTPREKPVVLLNFNQFSETPVPSSSNEYTIDTANSAPSKAHNRSSLIPKTYSQTSTSTRVRQRTQRQNPIELVRADTTGSIYSKVSVQTNDKWCVTVSNTPRSRAPLQLAETDHCSFTSCHQLHQTPSIEFRPSRNFNDERDRRTSTDDRLQNTHRLSNPAQPYSSLSSQIIYLPADTASTKQKDDADSRRKKASTSKYTEVNTESEATICEPSVPSNTAPYYRYSHLLVFPVQSMFQKSSDTVDAVGNRQTSSINQANPIRDACRKNCAVSDSDLSKIHSPERLRKSGVSQSLDLVSVASSTDETPTKHQRFARFSDCYPGVLHSTPDKQKRPHDFDPYDPYRPVWRKKQPDESTKTKSRSMSSLEWRVLKAFESKAFKPQMRAWRSGIDIASESKFGCQEELNSTMRNDTGSSVFAAEVCFVHDHRSASLTVYLLQLICPAHLYSTPNLRLCIQLTLFPQKMKRKSRLHPIGQIKWNDSIAFSQIQPAELYYMGVNIAVCRRGIATRSKILAQNNLQLANLNWTGHLPMWLTLHTTGHQESYSDRVEEINAECESSRLSQSETEQNSTCLLPYKVQLGLRYSDASGTLSVELLAAANIRLCRSLASAEVFFRVEVVSATGTVIGTCSSSCRKRSVAPLFGETCLFTVPLFQLSEVTLIVSLVLRKSMARDTTLGHVRFANNSPHYNARTHWAAMTASIGRNLRRWHNLSRESGSPLA